MSSNGDIKLGITLTGDASGLVGEVKVSKKSLDGLAEGGKKAGDSLASGMVKGIAATRKMTAAEKAASIKSNAFSTLRVRSDKAIRAEIEQVGKAYKRLAFRGSASASELARASKSTQSKVAALNAELRNGFTKLSAAQASYSRKSSAYASLQIRSDRAIKHEIALVQAGYKRLASSGSLSQQELARASRATKQRVVELNKELKGAVKNTSAFGSSVKGLVGVTAIFYGLQRGIKAAESAIVRNKSAMLGLSSVAKHYGIEIKDVLVQSLKLSSDGMMTNAEAAKALQNLLTRGFGLSEAVQMINRFRDSAAFGRQASLGFGQAVVSATEGIKNENSILVDNAGVTKNVSVMWKEYATQIGVGVGSLTQAQKRQAEYNGIMRETEAQLGNAARASDGLQGAQARMLKASDDAASSFGEALTPALTAFYNAGTLVMGNVKELAPFLPELEFGLAAVATQFVVGKVAAAGFATSVVTAKVAVAGLLRTMIPLASAFAVFEAGKTAIEAYEAGQDAAAARLRNVNQAVDIFGRILIPARKELAKIGIDLDNIHAQNIEEVTAALHKLNAERNKNAPRKAANDEPAAIPTTKIITPIDPKLVAKSLKDAQSLTRQLETAFDDTFTKTSTKYIETWQQLVQTHGAGSAQVKQLETAYQSWLTASWDKQDAKEAERNQQKADQEQERVNNVIGLQQAKYLRLNQSAAEAMASDDERALLRLDNDLLKMEEERQRLVDQHIWTEELETQYDQARIDRAQQTASIIGNIEANEASKRLLIEQRVGKAKISMLKSVANNAVGLMRAIAPQSKAAAIAGIVISKASAMAAAAQSTAAGSVLAAASQLIPGDPTSPIRAAAAASSFQAFGALNMGLIAATGLAEIAGVAKGGVGFGASGGVGGGVSNVVSSNASTGLPTQQQQAPQPIQITVVNTGNGTEFIDTKVIPQIQDRVVNADVQIVDVRSRNAQELMTAAA